MLLCLRRVKVADDCVGDKEANNCAKSKVTKNVREGIVKLNEGENGGKEVDVQTKIFDHELKLLVKRLSQQFEVLMEAVGRNRGQEQGSGGSEDWRRAAAALDRFFFLLFLCVILITNFGFFSLLAQ